ncbi:MAG: aminopeptidase P family protein [Lachnospiraceae bacterium]|nr:aminopeptidase P family protein [Lachnospiraceae bacterium]
MIRERIDRLRKLMKREGIDLYLIPTADFHQSEYVGHYFKCREFLSGFTGSAGSLIVTKEEACLFTDGRYHIQAERELKDSGIHLFRCGEDNIPTEEEYAQVYMKSHPVMGFDGRVVSAHFVEEFLKNTGLSKENIRADKDLAGELWQNRPERSANEIYPLDHGQTGESTENKLMCIRKRIKEVGADMHIIASLDDIAWIFNLRGSDVEYNPVFLSYAVITEEEAYLYVQRQAVGEELQKYLKEQHIQYREYDNIYEEIKQFSQGKAVLLDKKSINYRLYDGLEGARLIFEMNPSTRMKAVKNPVEIENTKKAHLKDGVAVTRFIHYIKKHAGTGINEYEAQKYLDGLRKDTEGCLGLSFETISAYEENGAMMHYSAPKKNSARLEKKGFLLVDSGGQYREGTTDVTRTIALGELSEDRKKYYTLTLMGMLRLMNAKFLEGCTGRNLDILARGPLWEHGVDYRCGTGHGVGHILNVHEGPNGIRWVQRKGLEEVPLEPGMITTDEPGVYFENAYGIRIENELLCVKDEKNLWGQFLKFECLTFVPIEPEAVDTAYMEVGDVELLNQYQQQVYEKISPYMTKEEQIWLREYTKPLKK